MLPSPPALLPVAALAPGSVLFPPHSDPLAGWLDSFECATTKLLKERELLKRVDQKFLAPVSSVPLLLAELSSHYRVLPAGAEMWASYRTCYFDTPELTCFHEHMRGRRPRFKVRVRHYPGRDKSFLEIKRKTSGGETVKARQAREFGNTELCPEDLQFIATAVPPGAPGFAPSVWTNFRRATLLGISTNERLTIDLDLTFLRNEESSREERLAIIELKQWRASHSTPAALALRKLKIRAASFSKYCAAVAALHEDARPRARHTMKLLTQRIIP